jgi:copper chaperone NosL
MTIPRCAVPNVRRLAAWACVLLALSGCGKDPAAQQHAVDVHKDDVCAVCGMYLDGSPGPRAEAWVRGRTAPLKFDSTRDFFAYVLQPENRQRLQALFVQDSERIDWEHPPGAAASFIDARTAFYVAWQPRAGSMGPTLAPYATRARAEAAAHAHGGEVLAFDAVTTELVSSLDYRCPARDAANSSPARQCLAPPRADAPFAPRDRPVTSMSHAASHSAHDMQD